DNLTKSITIIKNNLQIATNALIRNKIMSKDEQNLLQAASPLNLTPMGTKLLTDSGFISVFENNRNAFFNFINSETPRTKLDVELSAIKAVLLLFDKEFMNPVKIYLYNNPN